MWRASQANGNFAQSEPIMTAYPNTLYPLCPNSPALFYPQVSLVCTPLWHGLNGYPASQEILPGIARLLALLVAFCFSTIRLPPLWATHATYSRCDDRSGLKKRPGRLRGTRRWDDAPGASVGLIGAGVDLASPVGLPLSSLLEVHDD